MFDPEEHEGTWWLPEAPHGQVRGRLSFEEGGLALRIEDSLHEPPSGPGSFSLGIWTEIPLVFGLVDDEPVTLLEVAGLSMALPAMKVNEEWFAQFAVFGEHLQGDSRFDRIEMTCEHLNDFVGVRPVTPDVTWSDDGDDLKAQATAERATVTEGAVPSVGTVELFISPRFAFRGESTTIAAEGRVRFTPDVPMAIGELFSHAGRARELIRLSTHCECGFTGAWARPVGGSIGLRLLRPQTSVGRSPCTRSAPHRMIFTAHNLPGGQAVFARWWEIRVRYQRAWTLLTVHDDGRFPNAGERFAAYVRALEALHYTDFTTPKIAEAERDERVEEALAALPDHLLEWATPLLTSAYADYFRARLRELIAALGSVGTRLCGGDAESFITAATKTRNAVIHPPSMTNQGLDELGQMWMGTALYWLAHCYFVWKLGMSIDELDARLSTMSSVREVQARMEAAFGVVPPASPIASQEPDDQ